MNTIDFLVEKILQKLSYRIALLNIFRDKKKAKRMEEMFDLFLE